MPARRPESEPGRGPGEAGRPGKGAPAVLPIFPTVFRRGDRPHPRRPPMRDPDPGLRPDERIALIPLDRLELSPDNARRTSAGDAALAETQGLDRRPRAAGEPGRPAPGRRRQGRPLRGDRGRAQAGGDAGAGRGRRAGRRLPRALPRVRRRRHAARTVAGREHGPRRHAPGRPDGDLPPPGRRRGDGRRDRRALRRRRAHGRAAPAPGRRRAGAAGCAARRRDRPGDADRLRPHRRPGAARPRRGNR